MEGDLKWKGKNGRKGNGRGGSGMGRRTKVKKKGKKGNFREKWRKGKEDKEKINLTPNSENE